MVERNKGSDGDWHRDLVEKLAADALVERRRARRWGIFFKLLTFAYLTFLLVLLIPEDWSEAAMGTKSHTALVELEGVIAAGEKASADNVVTGLRDAFEDKHTKAVVLRINSPGGSPVQSSDIHKEILRLREKYPDIPLYAVVSDICASGGYFVASAADKIYVNESSVIGSIGVLINGFGFVDTIHELGIERRLMTAGEHKGILDPFTPLSEFDKAHVAGLLEDLHANFIDAVKTGRGDRLKGDDATLFSGLFWDGNDGIQLGLADAIGSAGYVAREVVGAEDLVDFTAKEDPLERLADRLGASAATTFGRLFGVSGGIPLR
ncbi:MAG: S49 family peptidase [Gammaproteobacteria bacterium]|nr:S49 family peptidase [Gammaproteobacteria bacterium]MCB1818781.1 S49 family peptidase [Gammaproteobacteria bacterium]MCP5316951.1 S49 family peptidase [Chromatiaceae bacterium]MCP5434480.1 S49 family peptidase [Chromatiaceae bacterium]MCW5586462.1 S49 family peptidase [Chromatiales bacterium]